MAGWLALLRRTSLGEPTRRFGEPTRRFGQRDPPVAAGDRIPLNRRQPADARRAPDRLGDGRPDATMRRLRKREDPPRGCCESARSRARATRRLGLRRRGRRRRGHEHRRFSRLGSTAHRPRPRQRLRDRRWRRRLRRRDRAGSRRRWRRLRRCGSRWFHGRRARMGSDRGHRRTRGRLCRVRARAAARWRRRLRRDTGGQECQRIDVALLVSRQPNAQVHVGFGPVWFTARPDRRDRVPFGDRVSLPDIERAEVLHHDRVAVGSAYRQRLAALRHRARKRHGAGSRRKHAGTEIAANVDSSMLAACIRVVPENERP